MLNSFQHLIAKYFHLYILRSRNKFGMTKQPKLHKTPSEIQAGFYVISILRKCAAASHSQLDWESAGGQPTHRFLLSQE